MSTTRTRARTWIVAVIDRWIDWTGHGSEAVDLGHAPMAVAR